MYRLNISFAVEPDAVTAWTDLMRGKFIPYLRENGFQRLALSRVLTEHHDGHFTFSLLMELDDVAAYRRVTEELWDEYAQMNEMMFGTDVVWFMSLMKEIGNE
ncbi:MAG: DUF4286 family protein [Rikenellaceae bacterium]|jgi:hypothetical protein|nr:DUF4286 family protein [Rikenellaceae bacterium]